MTERRARTWQATAPPVPQVQDPAVRAVLRSLRRALAMDLGTPRARQLAIAAIDRHCGPTAEEGAGPQE